MIFPVLSILVKQIDWGSIPVFPRKIPNKQRCVLRDRRKTATLR